MGHLKSKIEQSISVGGYLQWWSSPTPDHFRADQKLQHVKRHCANAASTL